MATIVNATEVAKASGLAQANALAKGGMDQFKQWEGILKTAESILTKVMTIRDGAQGQPSVQNASPAQIPHQAPPKNARDVKSQVVHVEKELDKEKIKSLLRDIIVNQAEKLPADLKERPLGTVIGENWDLFTVNYMGFKVSSDVLLDKIADQLMKTIPECYK